MLLTKIISIQRNGFCYLFIFYSCMMKYLQTANSLSSQQQKQQRQSFFSLFLLESVCNAKNWHIQKVGLNTSDCWEDRGQRPEAKDTWGLRLETRSPKDGTQETRPRAQLIGGAQDLGPGNLSWHMRGLCLPRLVTLYLWFQF